MRFRDCCRHAGLAVNGTSERLSRAGHIWARWRSSRGLAPADRGSGPGATGYVGSERVGPELPSENGSASDYDVAAPPSSAILSHQLSVRTWLRAGFPC